MLALQLALFGLSAAIALLFGLRYLLTRTFMPYHAQVAGRSWEQLEPGLQAIILGMLRIVGGGFLASGLVTLWLLLPLSQGQGSAAWAALTVVLATAVPSLYVTLWLRRVQPMAQTPVVPAAVAVGLGLAAAAVSLLR